MKFSTVNKVILAFVFVLLITTISYAEGGPPPPPSEKLPIPGIAYLAIAGLYYGYKKATKNNL